MDRIRIALGEHRLNFFGFSYGSHLGTTYAELFPDHFRTMALDGILDHSLAFDDLYVSSAGEFERVFGRFAAWCRQTADCPLAGRDARQVYDRIVARAEQQPLPAPDATSPRPVHESDIHRVTLSRLGTPEQWPTLAAAIASAAAGDASLFRDLADLVTSRAPDGTYGPSHGIERGALACLDWPPVARNASDVAAIAARARRAAPRLGTAIVWDNIPQCISWPRPAVNPPHRLHIHGAPPILLVAGRHDPNDPYAMGAVRGPPDPEQRPAHQPARRARRLLPLPLRPNLRRPVPGHPRPRPETLLPMNRHTGQPRSHLACRYSPARTAAHGDRSTDDSAELQ